MSNPTPTKQITVVTGNSMMTDTGRFEHMFRVAKVFAGSQLVPKHLQGKVEDVMIALNIADRLGEDPLTVMQSIYIVSGKAGWSASYMIARINGSGLIKGRITWDVEGAGKDLKVTAKATLADTGEVVTAPVSMQMAMAEGWTSNKKYQSMPDMMLRYRSAAMLQRLYFPEVMLGMKTAEEIETDTVDNSPKDITPRKTAAGVLEAFASRPQEPDPEIINAGPEASGQHPDPVPEPQIVDSTVPEDGANVFNTDDEAAAKALEDRAGVVRENVADIVDADTGEIFNPDEYLEHVVNQLQMMVPEEVAAAHAGVKGYLSKYPKQLGAWNTARFKRLSEYADQQAAMKKPGGGGRATR